MARQLWLADVVGDAFRGVQGFQVDTVTGWQQRGNVTFDPEGVMDHHTGPGSYANLLNYMVYGSSISPLCNIATSRPYNGIVRITICNAGRANHAGVGELPWRKGQGSTGNRRTIGIEHQNSGSQAWPAQQVEAMRRLDAALLKHMGKDTSRMLDHKTYTNRKVDRYATNVDTERREVAKLMAPAPKPPPPPAPVDEWEVFWMSLTDKEREFLKRAAEQGVRDEVDGQSFVRQFMLFHREERPQLKLFLDEVKRFDSSLVGQVRAAVTMWREAGARGWKRDTNAVLENRHYTKEELGLDESY